MLLIYLKSDHYFLSKKLRIHHVLDHPFWISDNDPKQIIVIK